MTYLLWLLLMFGKPHYYQPVYLPAATVIVQPPTPVQVAGPGLINTRCQTTVVGKGQMLVVCP